jgi:hypothetical protein
MKRLAFALIVLASVTTLAQTTTPQSSSALVLEDGTPVTLRVGRTVSSEDATWAIGLILRFSKKSELMTCS